MQAAICACRESCYWNSEIEATYSFLDRILQFRHACQADMMPSLCKAIAMTQQSLSKDPRDSIFALLGICHDGAELVSTPSYQQPLELIVVDISRILFRRKRYLEVVLIIRVLDTENSSTSLPSWVPDGVIASMPENSYALVNKRLASMGRLCMTDTIGEISLSFQVQGVIIGTIVAATSTITSDGGGDSNKSPRSNFEGAQLTDQSTTPTAYYSSHAEVAAALFSCLTKREDLTSGRRRETRAGPSSRDSGFPYYIRALRVWHAFCLYFAGCDIPPWSRFCLPLNCCYLSRKNRMRSPNRLESGEKNLVTHELLVEWFNANINFMIQGRTLKNWARRKSFGALILRWIDSLGCLILVWAIVSLGIVLSFLYQYRLIYLSDEALFGILVPLVTFSSIQMFVFSLYRYKVFHLVHKIQVNMAHILNTPKKLVRLDTGVIGMAYSGTQSGDRVCLLSGRTILIVLRGVGTGDRAQYAIVGDIYVYLSGTDRKLYNGFIDQKADGEVTDEIYYQEMWMKHAGMRTSWGPECGSKGCVSAKERARCIDRYKKDGILQNFHLV